MKRGICHGRMEIGCSRKPICGSDLGQGTAYIRGAGKALRGGAGLEEIHYVHCFEKIV